jgi:hypothetical protein
MTRALVVYESLFGDAQTIANAIASGLSEHMAVDVVAADGAPADVGPDVGLVVVGGPNHALSMPRPATREGAVQQYGAQIANTGRGLHEWLETVRIADRSTAAVAFDTRSDHPKLLVKMDHAAKMEEKLLRGHGLTVLAPAEHFYVIDAKGPLADGEEERAARWGTSLAELAARASARA